MIYRGDSNKHFNVLKFIMRMLKIGAWLAVGFTTIMIGLLLWQMMYNWNNFVSQEFVSVWSYLINQLLIISVLGTAGYVTSLLIYGASELLDLLVSIQGDQQTTANILRAMYADQLQARGVRLDEDWTQAQQSVRQELMDDSQQQNRRG